MKIIVTSLFDQNTLPISKITSDRISDYCKLHNYDCIINEFTDTLDPWYKMQHIINLLKNNNCDYLCWIDIDTYIIDINFKLEILLNKSNKEIYSSTDNSGICFGFFIVKNTPNVIKLFEILAYLKFQSFKKSLPYDDKIGGFPVNDSKIEQNPLKILGFYFEKIENMFYYIDQSVIMNPVSTDNGVPFVFHFWSLGWSKKEKMLHHITNLQNNVIDINSLKKWYE
jgi:hypothetical protein